MADQKNVTVNEAAQEVTPAAETTKEQQNAAPETTVTSAEPAQPEKEKKSVWQTVKAGAKKVGETVKRVAPLVGVGLAAFAAGKAIGKVSGMETAINSLNPDPTTPALPQNDDVIGVDDVVDADFAEIDVTADPVIDTPAE